MIAVTSCRPKSKCHPEIWRNQIEAHKTWERCFTGIYYLGNPEQELTGPRTRFLTSEPWPTIKYMCEICASFPGWSCIINADIVLLSDTFNAVCLELQKQGAASAMSFRFEFDPDDPERRTKNYDLGLDIFMAKAHVWDIAANRIPKEYRIGHGAWDTWMLGFFNTMAQPCIEFTGSRCVLHPKHENRIQPFAGPAIQDSLLGAAQPPKRKIAIKAASDMKLTFPVNCVKGSA